MSSNKPKRLFVLVTLLVAAALALILKQRFYSSPTTPRRYASVAEKRDFYVRRIKTNPEDVNAFVELGKIEESQEFYISALRRLYTARALGAPEREIALPLGRSLSHLARWDEAIHELDEAVRLMPDSLEAAANLAGAYFSGGDARHASEVLNEFLLRHRHPDGAPALSVDDLHRLMLCYAEARDQNGAASVARSIIRLAPDDPGAYSIVGHTLVLAGHYKEALSYLARASSLEPNVAALCYNYGTALEQCGRTGEALIQLQRCVLLNPNASDAFLSLASIYEKRKNWKLAAVAMSNAALHSKTDVKVLYRAARVNERAGNLSDAEYWYSNAALAAGKYQEALGYASKLSEGRDQSWQASGSLNMAEAYRGLHRMKEYLALVKRVANHETAQDYVRLADAYEKADLLDKQVEYLRLAMAKDPSVSAEAHSAIAQNMLRRGRRDEAEHELEQAVAADPKNADYRTQLGNTYLERRYVGDRIKRAVAQFEQAAQLTPKDATAYQNLGIACAAANDLGHAAAYLEHAIDLEPGYGPSYEELGRVYARMGDRMSSDAMLALYRKYVRYDLTLKTLSARADQNKKDPRAQVELADLLVKSGDYGSALDRYSLALRLKPADPGIRLKYDKIVEMLTQSRASHGSKQ